MVPLKLNKGRKSILGGNKMRKSVLIAILFLFFVSFLPLNAQWARTYGGSNGEWGQSIQQTADGGYIVAGYTGSFGDLYADFWILKLDIDGLIEWEKTYGGSGEDWATSIQQTSDGGYIAAGVTDSFDGFYDVWILKLDTNGEIEWQKIYKAGTMDNIDISYSIQQTTDGGYIVVIDGPIGGYDAWILKLFSTGDIEWQKGYEKTSWGGFHSIQQTTDGGYIVAGYGSPSYDSYDARILKLDATGAVEWQKGYGENGYNGAESIQQTTDGGYIVAGYTDAFGAGYKDAWILKLDVTGNIEWQKTYGGIYSDIAQSIQETVDNGYIVGGYTKSFGAGNKDFWILKLDPDGNVKWEKTYGGPDRDEFESVQQTTDNGYVVVGKTKSFGVGKEDILILKLFPDGNIHSSCGFVEESYAVITDTAVLPGEISEIIQDIDSTLSDTTALPQDSDAIVTLLCEFPKHNLTISATSGGTTDPEPDTYTHYEETEVTITAIPDENYRFKEWTGDVPAGHETDSPMTLTMDLDKSVTANFVRQYQLTIVAGEGGTTEPVPDDYIHDSGAEITITAIPDQDYRFLEWTGDVPEGQETNNPFTITVDSDKTITANFIREYTLTIITGEEGTTNPLPGTHIYDVGAEVSIEAMPDENYRFLEWTGDVLSGHEEDNPLTITMDSDKSITANFVQQQYTLTITAGTGGTTEPVPDTYIHDSGTEVSITATPNTGYEFTEWTGDASGTTNPITIIMDSDKSVKANFKATPTPEEPKKKKGGCFIATAAYGSPLHPHIDILRKFRDKHLMTNRIGRTIVNFYYKYSPPIANFISKHKLLKIAVRIRLRPLISLSYLIVH